MPSMNQRQYDPKVPFLRHEETGAMLGLTLHILETNRGVEGIPGSGSGAQFSDLRGGVNAQSVRE
jgi:hypothetical protein